VSGATSGAHAPGHVLPGAERAVGWVMCWSNSVP